MLISDSDRKIRYAKALYRVWIPDADEFGYDDEAEALAVAAMAVADSEIAALMEENERLRAAVIHFSREPVGCAPAAPLDDVAGAAARNLQFRTY